MATGKLLSKSEPPLPLREAWKHEAGDFTLLRAAADIFESPTEVRCT